MGGFRAPRELDRARCSRIPFPARVGGMPRTTSSPGRFRRAQCGSHDAAIALRPARCSGRRAGRPAARHRARFAEQVNRREADGGRGVPARPVRKERGVGRRAELAAHGGGLLGVGDGPHARGGKERGEARDGLLQHRAAADDVEQLLRRARAAARPEARAASAGEDHGVRFDLCAAHGNTAPASAASLTPRAARSRSSAAKSGT